MPVGLAPAMKWASVGHVRIDVGEAGPVTLYSQFVNQRGFFYVAYACPDAGGVQMLNGPQMRKSSGTGGKLISRVFA